MIFFDNEKKKADRLIKDFFNAESLEEALKIQEQLIQMGEIVVEPLLDAVSQKMSNLEFINSFSPMIIYIFGELKDGRSVKTIINLYK